MRHDQADKLDCLMYVLFEYINSICTSNGNRHFSANQSNREFFFSLLQDEWITTQRRISFEIFFKCSIKFSFQLTIHLMFNFFFSTSAVFIQSVLSSSIRLICCFLLQDFSEEFMNNCWRTFVSPSVSMTFRQSAICYLCSLIARAKYIPIR